MHKRKNDSKYEIIHDEPKERVKDRRLTLIGIVVGAVVTIVAAIIASNAGVNLNQIFNFGRNSIPVVTATPDNFGATQVAIGLTQTAISQPTKVEQQTTSTVPAIPARTAAPTDIPLTSILYENDLENGRTDGMKFETGTWRVITEDNGNHVLQGESATEGWWSVAHIGSANWKNYAVELRFRWVTFGALSVTTRASNFVDGYEFSMHKDGISFTQLREDTNNVWQHVQRFYDIGSPEYLKRDDWNRMIFIVVNDAFRVSINGQWLSDVFDNDSDVYLKGLVSLSGDSNAVVWFDDIRIWSLD